MKTIKGLDAPIYNLNEKPIIQDTETLTIRRALATIIGRGVAPDPVRAMKLAHDLWHSEGNKLEIEDADFKALNDLVTRDTLYTNIVRAPILEALDAAKKPVKEAEVPKPVEEETETAEREEERGQK